MWEQIRYNQTRTAMLIVGMAILWLMIGFVLGVIPAFPLKISFTESCSYGIVAASIIWIIMSLVAYFQGDNIILALSKAQKIGANDLHRLHNIVEELKISSGLETMPSIYIIDDPALNAFAVGCDPNKAAVVVTSGLLQKLNRDELQGVIGHEIAHIKNRDVLLMTMCSMFLGATIVLSWINVYGGGWTRNRLATAESDKGRKDVITGGLALLLASIILTMVMLIVAAGGDYKEFRDLTLFMLIFWGPLFFLPIPIVAMAIFSAISTRREYLADACSALYTRYPEGLASALEKIAASTNQLKSANLATAPIYIVNPFRDKGMAASDVTETHPPISERISILRSMARVSYADYDRAYRQIRGTDESVIPAYATALTGTAAIREAVPEDMSHIQRARETTNVLWNLNNYKIIKCPCGTRLRLPPSYKQPEIRCPHCGRINPV